MRTLDPAAPWARNFFDLPSEHGFVPLAATGAFPPELRGTLYRVGPGLFGIGRDPYAHWFDGDGATVAVRLGDGVPQGAVRLVASEGLRVERKAGRQLFAAYGVKARGLPPILTPSAVQKNPANTSAFVWQDRLFALFEAGRPTELDPETLATLGERDLDGALGAMFSAHPHRVPALATTFNFGVELGRKPMLHLYALPDAGPARRHSSHPLPFRTLVHDFIATPRHAVFFLAPVVLHAAGLLFGFKSVSESLKWEPKRGTTVLVVPWDRPEAATRFEVEPFYQWHFANAWEAPGAAGGDTLVVDFVRYPDFTSNAWLGGLIRGVGAPVAPGVYQRAELDLGAKTLRTHTIWDRGVEFPRIDPRREGTRHRYAWVAANRADATPGTELQRVLAKLDVDSGNIVSHELPGLAYVSEPIFVPRDGGAGSASGGATAVGREDDGWVLALVYDAAVDTSRLVVHDAATLEPIASAEFGHAVPYTFHGTWAPLARRS